MIAAQSGISNIVALSSIHLSLGHSAATHNGAMKTAIQIGVPSWYQHAIQIIARKIDPETNTVLGVLPFLLTSPKNGSPSDKRKNQRPY